MIGNYLFSDYSLMRMAKRRLTTDYSSSIPLEIWGIMICRYLDQEDLKNYRLISKRHANNEWMWQYLFSRVYVSIVDLVKYSDLGNSISNNFQKCLDIAFYLRVSLLSKNRLTLTNMGEFFNILKRTGIRRIAIQMTSKMFAEMAADKICSGLLSKIVLRDRFELIIHFPHLAHTSQDGEGSRLFKYMNKYASYLSKFLTGKIKTGGRHKRYVYGQGDKLSIMIQPAVTKHNLHISFIPMRLRRDY